MHIIALCECLLALVISIFLYNYTTTNPVFTGNDKRSVLKQLERSLFMSKKFNALNQKGFTLIELISVMIIMGVVASVSIQRFDVLADTTNQRLLVVGVKELNIRESLTWSDIKISADGYTNDEELYPLVNKNLGGGFGWDPGPDIGGGTLTFKGQSIILTRVASTRTSAGRWQ